MCAVAAIWLASSTMRNDSNLWPIDLASRWRHDGGADPGRTHRRLVYWRFRAGQKLAVWVVGAAIATLALAAWLYL
jgi:hypothetical protein